MSDQEPPLFLVVTIKPRLDRLEEAEAQLQSMRGNSLTEPGCVFMHLLQPHDDPDTWVMLEMFRSRTAWDEHMRQPYNTESCCANRQICACSTRSRSAAVPRSIHSAVRWRRLGCRDSLAPHHQRQR